MKFFGREEEMAELRRIREISRESARFTVVTGRRRVGKTELLRQTFDDGAMPCLYLLVTRRPEQVQSRMFQRAVEENLGIRILGVCGTFKDVLTEIMAVAAARPLTLIIDEFQEFDRVNPGVFGDVQAVWDAWHTRAKINLVVCGSVNRLMNRIFFNDGEPLYGRNTGKLHLEPFKVSLLKTILRYHHPSCTNSDLLALWTITGGVARYVDLLMTNKAFTLETMLATVFGRITSFVDEGKTVLVEEFGKDYGTYFAILSAIASGRTSHAEIANEIGTDLGGYLTKLENDYSLIVKKQPIFERTRNKNCHYAIDDCFFRFWFCFIYRRQHLVELGRFKELRQLAARDFAAFSGYALERYFFWKFREETSCTRMGGWWDRKGENEIDLVCDDELKQTLDFYEVKRDPKRLDLDLLRRKCDVFLTKNPELKERRVAVHGLSLADM